MKQFTAISLGLLLTLTGTRASASPLHVNIHIDINGHDLHLGHGNLLGGLLGGFFHGGFGGGFGGLLDGGFLGLSNFEAQQARYEEKFADITAAYDDGVANIENFYASDEYDDVVDDATRLVHRYDFFVTRVEHSIDFLGTAIDASNDSLTFVQDLLADYQSRDLSEKRLAHIEDVLTTVQDNIQLKIDFLTEKQTTLTENLPTYQDFQSQLTTYRDTIVAAGGGTTDDEDASSAAHRALAATTESAATASGGVCAAPSGGPSAVPEPSAASLAVIASVALLRRRRRIAGA